jgi:hypothetical protein
VGFFASIAKDFLSNSPVGSIRPLIAVVENTRRELSWGSLRVKTRREEKFFYSTMTPAGNLGEVILASMKHVEATLLFVFEHTAGTSGPKPPENETSTQILHRLDQARDAAREKFAGLFRGMNEDAPKNELTSDASDHFLFLVSLIEVCLYLPKYPANVSTFCSDGQRNASSLACR